MTTGLYRMRRDKPCRDCQGTGHTEKGEECPSCGGTGIVSAKKLQRDKERKRFEDRRGDKS